MHPNAELIERFYTCFQSTDAQGMGECYHDEVAFSDPVFTDLKGWKARAMWQMLCARAENFELVFRDVVADDETGSAFWQASYDFSQTGRRIVNKITASFEFKDGLIIKHTDRFDLWKWAGMALGPTGKLLGWLPPVQNKIRGQAGGGLRAYIKAKGLDPAQP